MSVCDCSHFQYETSWKGHDWAPSLLFTVYLRMSTLKYEADGFCSDWRRRRSVKAGILNSSVVLMFVDWSLSLNILNKLFKLIKIDEISYTLINCLFGKIFSRFWTFFMRKHNFAGFGLLAKTLTMPAGNESIMSPDIFTWQRDSSLPLQIEKKVLKFIQI